ncbi:unnamed protein product [Rhodiola kirilowii]
MRVFSWNCRGLGRPWIVRALRDAVRSLSPQIVCLIETKKQAAELEGTKFKLGFHCCFGVSSKGRSGGLAMFWGDSVNVEIKSYSHYHIDAVVKEQSEFRLTLFYGDPSVSNRRESWNLLRQLRRVQGSQWVVLGDFNEILCVKEARGGRQRQNWQIENFIRALEDCNLTDLGFTGYPFTFSNHRVGEAKFQARLDRVVADDEWRLMFPRATVSHIHLHASDHQLILLDTDRKCRMRRKKFFRFEAMWFDHSDYAKMMGDFWDNMGSGTAKWSDKLKSCKGMLKSWNHSTFGDVRKRIQKLKQELLEIKSGPRSTEKLERERKVSEDLDIWLAREETLWMQRSRILWMSQGDKNTKFFHARASQRRKKNWIEKLQDGQGVVHEDQNKIMEIISSYFSNLFQSTLTGNTSDLDAQLRSVAPVVNDDMNAWLLKEISDEEIRAAVFALGPLKSPGIDGFLAIFIKNIGILLKGVS